MIQVRHLSKAFGRVIAVKGLSFDAPDGAITGLLGPNGAGKTTTLRMISGVLRPTPARFGLVLRAHAGTRAWHDSVSAHCSTTTGSIPV
jgi:ABC-type multidrug transport system ATPase subunit